MHGVIPRFIEWTGSLRQLVTKARLLEEQEHSPFLNGRIKLLLRPFKSKSFQFIDQEARRSGRVQGLLPKACTAWALPRHVI